MLCMVHHQTPTLPTNRHQAMSNSFLPDRPWPRSLSFPAVKPVTTGQYSVFTLAVLLALSSELRIFFVTTRTLMLLSRARTSTCATILVAVAPETPSTVETTFETIFVNITVKISRSVEQLSTRNGLRVDMRPLPGGAANAALFESTSPRTVSNALDARHPASLSARRSVAADPEFHEQENSLAHRNSLPQSTAKHYTQWLETTTSAESISTKVVQNKNFCHVSSICRLFLLWIAHRHWISLTINPALTAKSLSCSSCIHTVTSKYNKTTSIRPVSLHACSPHTPNKQPFCRIFLCQAFSILAFAPSFLYHECRWGSAGKRPCVADLIPTGASHRAEADLRELFWKRVRRGSLWGSFQRGCVCTMDVSVMLPFLLLSFLSWMDLLGSDWGSRFELKAPR